MALVAWIQHRCTRCGTVYAETLSENPIFLGSGTRECRGCHATIQDGSREWSELTNARRRAYLLSNGAIVFLLSGALFGGMAATLADTLSEGLSWAGGVAFFFAVPLIPIWGWKAVQIARSCRRYANAK
jgi:hypothetical protein